MDRPDSALVFDIETRRAVGLAEKLGVQEKIDGLDAMEVDDLQSFAADQGIALGNRNKRDSVYPYIVAHYGKMIDKAALKMFGAEIYAIAFGALNGSQVKAVAVTEDLDEKQLITRFLEAIDKNGPHVMCGFNIRNFDIPVLRTRCMILGIHWPTWLPQNRRQDKYDDTVIFDCCDILDEGTLDTWLRMFGLPPKTASGAMVSDMSPREVATYCAADVDRERLLTQKLIGHTHHKELLCS